MYGTRIIGQNHIYLDSHLDGYSNVAVGLLVRAVGHGMKVAYVDVGGGATKFTNFLENVSLSYSFVRKFDRLHIEIFRFKNDDKVSKTIIPLVEFSNINYDLFWDSIDNYDLVVFDNVSFDNVDKKKVLSFLESKDMNCEVVFVFNNEKDFDGVKDAFDLITKYDYKSNNSLVTKQSIVNITGDGKGKSTYSFGYLIRNFILKSNVKLIYFDKGGDFYGERFFFNAIKKWSVENNLYGSFDYTATGLKRFDGKSFRFDNVLEDVREARDGLMLLNTAMKKNSLVIAEELNTTIKTGLLKIDEVMHVLDKVENDLMITGRYSPKEILNISSTIIEVQEIKHYCRNGQGVRKGIDF